PRMKLTYFGAARARRYRALAPVIAGPGCVKPPFPRGPIRATLPTKDFIPMQEIKLQDLKLKSPTELLAFAEKHEVENASIMRKQELMFAILKQLASRDIEIVGEGVIEVLQDGFGFLRSPDA